LYAGAETAPLALAANATGTRTFGRRLFFEADSLSFVQLIEVACHRATMEEPLLAAVVAYKPEPSVTN
jgi:hypothetical protein